MSSGEPADLIFRALAESNRRRILRAVGAGSRTVGEIAALTGLSQQTASHHLGVLAGAGILTGTRAGTRHLFAVDTDGIGAARAFLDEFWPARLQALKSAVERSATEASGADGADGIRGSEGPDA